MTDVTYALLLGAAIGAYLLIVGYWIAESVATWRRRRADRTRRFFVEAGNAATLADLRVKAGEIERPELFRG